MEGITFHLLFYLMVLINGYTISKSDVDDYTPDTFVDSRALAAGRQPRRHTRRGRRGHEDPATTRAGKSTELVTIAARLKDSFWKRFRHRNKTAKSKHSHIDGIKSNGLHNNYFGKKRHSNRNEKREISTEFVFENGFFKDTDFLLNNKNNQLRFFNMTSLNPSSSLNNITSVASSLTTPKSTQSETTASTLSTLQGILDSKKSSSNLKTSTFSSKFSTTAEWIGTAQLEVLLDNIKARAMQVLIDNNPTVTSLITNSVNEITFESDPLLHHIDHTTPHPKAAAILKTSNIHKRTTETANTAATSHHILRRSPMEAISTIANSVEHTLQKELKKVYAKLKSKVSSYHNLKTTAAIAHYKRKHPKKTVSRTTKAATVMIGTTKVKEKHPEMKAHHRVAKATGFGKKKKVTTTSSTADANPVTCLDDSKLIGLLEQVLLKTSESNVLRMMSTSFTPRSNIERFSKRNIETLADLKLKEQVDGYEHGEMIPDALEDVGANLEDAETTSNSPDLGSGTFSTEGISFESISDKISYNDYVNGYKYYLKYQQEQEQDDEKFSPMIRFQAHKHHKVDDIGKYILRKIPQIRRSRNIFDDIDMDDQDISTKSDDSWFKKHFYMFLDGNTPKKFHTSETVSLKSALTEPSVDPQPPMSMALGKPAEQSMRPPLASQRSLVEDASNVNLYQLAHNLESYKAELSTTTMSSLVAKLMKEGKDEQADNGFMIKMMSKLLGGKDRRALKKVTPNLKYQLDPRFRRHVMKSKHKETHEKTTTEKITQSESRIPEHKDKFSKLGVVQMIAQPTTVVKIPAKKKSKLKNLMRKLHLTKKEKSNKIVKTQIRKQRFVPFKRIKELFLGSDHESHETARSKVANDFDIMTSEIDTFKAVKFSQIPNIDEMRKEIPNINEDLVPDAVYTNKAVTMTRPAVDFDSTTRPAATDLDSSNVSMEFLLDKSHTGSNVKNEIQQMIQVGANVTDEMQKMTMTQLEHYLVNFKKSLKGATSQLDNSATKPPETVEKPTTQTAKNLDAEDIYALDNLEAQNNKKEDETMKLAKTEGPFEVNENSAPELNLNNDAPAEETMDLIRDEIDKLKTKLTMYEPLEETTEQNKRPISNVVSTVTKVMFIPARIQKLDKQERNKKNNRPKPLDPQTPKLKREVTDFESAIESPRLSESLDKANYRPINKFSIPFIPIRRDSSHITKMSNSMHARGGYSPKKTLSQYSVSPDDFGELLLWHSDILNVDLLTTTAYASWTDEDVGMAGYTTPNAALLANEVQDIKHFISNLQPINYIKKVSNTYKTTAKRNTTTDRYVSMSASTIMKDDCSVGENEIVVVGQSQYFSFSKDDNSDYDSELSSTEKKKPRVGKKSKDEAAQPVLKQVSARSNWTNLSPRPNVVYNTSPRSRAAPRLWRKHLIGRQLLTTKLLSPTKSLTPTSKANQAPEQYFSTPLPMDSQDFEDFLKRSHLDVNSVTAPITEVNISTERLCDSATINDLKLLPSVTEPPHSDDPLHSDILSSNALRLKYEKEYLMNALSQLKLSAKNLSQIADDSYFTLSDDARFRRHSSYSARINKAMKRRKIFSKTSSVPAGLDLSEYSDPSMANKENIDYEPKYNTEDSSKYTTEAPQTVTVEMTKLNNLLYFYIPRKIKNFTMSAMTESVLADTEQFTVELPKELTTEIPKLIRNLGLKHNNHPKRVHISYHYDVLFENRPNLKARTRSPARREQTVEKVTHNSEAGEVATRRPGLRGQRARLHSHTDSSKKPFQTKRRLSNVRGFQKKSKRDANASVTEKPVLSKRNVCPTTYTVQNVAAFEIYLDLSKSTQAANIAPVPERNALQVHIALPDDQRSVIKRQLNPFKPVFSAKMSDAVNLEYQVPALEETITTESQSLSPGLYMLVDNLYKSGHVTLEPILSDLSVLRPRQAVSVKLTTESTTPKCVTNNLEVLKKVTLNKDFIAAVNKHLVQLYENFSSLNSADGNVKKSVTFSNVKKNDVTNRRRRDIWPALKEMLGGERTCSCHFKENHTLCPACVATESVVEELIFEFNNLANFMKDHCTEIQTFFWMNPNGGKKLTDSVHRLDRMLHDYYKRVKGKCQGKTCQALASRLDKRTIRDRRRIIKENGLLPEDLHAIADDIANILNHRLPYSKILKENGEEFLNIVDNCLPGLRYKKSVTTPLNDHKHKSNNIYKHNHVKDLRFGTKISNYKREATQIEKPFISDSGGSFWSDYINKRSTETQSIDQQPLMTETTLNALTHNLNELFMLFNNLNLTEVDRLTKLAEKDIPQDNKKNKKSKKKKKKQKKTKKKHKFLHRLHKKIKGKKPNDKTNTLTETDNFDALLSIVTDKSPTTRALHVILSNFQERPSLYVKVDRIAANTTYTPVLAAFTSNFTSETNSKSTHILPETQNTEVLSSGETVLFEEGCDVKNNFLNKLKHLFNGNNNTSTTPSYNFMYRKRSARVPTVSSETIASKNAALSLGISVLAPTDLISIVTTPRESVLRLTSENTAHIDEPTCPPSEPTYECNEPKCPEEDLNCPSSVEPKCPPTEGPKCPPAEKPECLTPEPCKNKETIETVECTPSSQLSSVPTPKDNSLLEDTSSNNTEDVITELTEEKFPTIIIIDEASTGSATDEMTIDIMPSTPNDDAKDLLLSVLIFEKQILDEELRRVRDSRQANDEEKETNDNLVHQLFLRSKSRTKSHKHPASFASGNYSLFSDFVQATKMVVKGRKSSTKSSTRSTTKDLVVTITTTQDYDTYDKWSTWVNATDKSPSKLTSTAHATTKPKVTQEVTATSQVLSSTTVQTPPNPAADYSTTAPQTKASDARPVPPAPRVCDLSATVGRVRQMRHRLSASAFEDYVKNLACFRFRQTPEYFVVAENKVLINPRLAKSKHQGEHNLKLKWDWIRNQREVDANEGFISNNPEDAKTNHENCNGRPTVDDMLVNFVLDDDFEKFYKGEHGIYKMANSKRKRRKADVTNLTRELTDLPAMHSTANEILAMSGDPVVLHCSPASRAGPPDIAVQWTAKNEALLRRPNVKIDGDTVRIDGIQESNAGSYVCKEGDSERHNVHVRVLVAPEYQIMFTLMYAIQDDSCGYNDLRAIRSLASMMSHLVCPKRHCSVTVHQPDCLKDRSGGSALLRATTSLEVYDAGVRCSADCRRDLAAQLVKLAVVDIPKLVTVNVLLAGDKNKTLAPFTARDGSFAVTRRLKRRGSIGKQKCYPHLPPGSVDVVVSCPRRYQLLPAFKICVADPLNTWSKAMRLEPAHRRSRRYEWWWYPPCGYVAAVAAVAAGCAACGVASLLWRPRERGKSCWAEASRQPASPSRVMLARLFKRSLSAFRHTDSQETRSFPSKPAPPPLPPIDFD